MMSGATIGQYRIESKLGEGGAGEVHLAIDTVLGRTVAIKRLRPELAARPQIVDRFRGEAQTLATLNHPNIATLYGLEWDGDAPVMIMEHVDGVSLAALVRRLGPLTLEQTLSIFGQALDGMAYIHRQGVVHRDIKGSNLLIDSDGVLKIMDFGISRVLGSERLTKVGQLVGTPEFMSPEQIRGEEPDARSDLYSLGILLWLLLSGRLPFEATGEFDVLKAQVEQPPPLFSEYVPDVPDGITALLARALAKDPAKRFQNAEDFRAALAPFMAPATEPLSLAGEAESGSELKALVAATRASEVVRGELERDPQTLTADRVRDPAEVRATRSHAGGDADAAFAPETTPWLTAVPLGPESAESARPRRRRWGWGTAVGLLVTTLALGVAANHLWLEARGEQAPETRTSPGRAPDATAASASAKRRGIASRDATVLLAVAAAERPELALESEARAAGVTDAPDATGEVDAKGKSLAAAVASSEKSAAPASAPKRSAAEQAAAPKKTSTPQKPRRSKKQASATKSRTTSPARAASSGSSRNTDGKKPSSGSRKSAKTQSSAKPSPPSKSTEPPASEDSTPQWMIRRD